MKEPLKTLTPEQIEKFEEQLDKWEETLDKMCAEAEALYQMPLTGKELVDVDEALRLLDEKLEAIKTRFEYCRNPENVN